MRFSHVKLANWKNFQSVDLPLRARDSLSRCVGALERWSSATVRDR